MDVTSSGDALEDKLEREQFSRKYEEMHRLVREPDGTTVLYIGAENWPFPVPLVSKNGEWHFDSDSGKKEILARRIGENELTAIQICKEFATIQNDAVATAARAAELSTHRAPLRCCTRTGRPGTSASSVHRSSTPVDSW